MPGRLPFFTGLRYRSDSRTLILPKPLCDRSFSTVRSRLNQSLGPLRNEPKETTAMAIEWLAIAPKSGRKLLIKDCLNHFRWRNLRCWRVIWTNGQCL